MKAPEKSLILHGHPVLTHIIRKKFNTENPAILFAVRLLGAITGYLCPKRTGRLLETIEGKKDIELISTVMAEMNVSVNAVGGIDNIPEQGVPTMIVSNHPSGPMDFMCYVEALKAKRQDIKVVVTPQTEAFEGLKDMIITIDKNAELIKDKEEKKAARKKNISEVKKIVEHLENGGLVCLYPAGGIAQPNQNDEVEEKSWDRNLINQATKVLGTKIVPAFTSAAPHPGLHKLNRKLRGIFKTIFKQDEETARKNGGDYAFTLGFIKALVTQENDQVNVKFGEPIEATKENTTDALVQEIRKMVIEQLPVEIEAVI